MLLEYQLDWIKIVDFLLIAKFLASANNFGTPTTWTALYFPLLLFPVLTSQFGWMHF